MSESELACLSRVGRRRSLRAGESLICEGDSSTLVANVISGLIKLTTSSADGREQIVGVAYPSDFIGRPFGPTTNYSAVALTDATVCVFPRAQFDRFATEHPALGQKLLERTLAELDRTRKWMHLLGRKSAEGRLASFLLELSHRLPDSPQTAGRTAKGKVFELPFSRQQIADILGLTIETVSRQMTVFKRNGVMGFLSRRTIELRDRAALEEMAG
ncbi:Crp/Fnr family transcriptional regulator [Tsuneonella sp. HG249]